MKGLGNDSLAQTHICTHNLPVILEVERILQINMAAAPTSLRLLHGLLHGRRPDLPPSPWVPTFLLPPPWPPPRPPSDLVVPASSGLVPSSYPPGASSGPLRRAPAGSPRPCPSCCPRRGRMRFFLIWKLLPVAHQNSVRHGYVIFLKKIKIVTSGAQK